MAALPAALRVASTRRVTMTDAVTLGGAALAIYGRFKARTPVRLRA